MQLHYDRCITYYSSLGGWGQYGAASDEEKRLTMMLFTGLFDALAEKVNIKVYTSCLEGVGNTVSHSVCLI